MGVPQFGRQESGWTYEARPGAYALITDDEDRLLIVRNSVGNCGLPGGGIDTGESPEEALAREVREETGYAITVESELCRANQFLVAPAESRAFNKQGIFYIGRLNGQVAAPTEPDHWMEWLDIKAALGELTEDSQRWAVRQLLIDRRP